MQRLLPFLLILMSLPQPALADADSYPGRAIYPMAEVLTTDQLHQRFADVVLVDVRSPFEYDTLHINTAVNIPLHAKDFIARLEALERGGKPLVFYCNGHKCYHSYRAFVKAKKAGLSNMYAYDSGVFDWTRAHPDMASLMGKTPVDLNRLIGKDKLKQHLLQPDQFMSKVSGGSIILDIREPAQRGLLELFPYRQRNISLSERDKLLKFISGRARTGDGRTLLVYDEGGTQVRWLQYHLEAQGVKRYYFMSGGITQYFKDIRS